jgi:dynein heavy chain
VEPANEAEEYEAVMTGQVGGNVKVHARKVSYNRYKRYIEDEIQVDVIAPIRQYWLTHIIELIPGDLHAVDKERIEYLIDSMLNEINKDYFDSVRKSIMDYILKDENEMRRLGIQQVINQPITWGDDFYKGIEPNEDWKHNVMMARMLMSENLCICSQATLELMRIWREKNYCNSILVDLPKPEDQAIDLDKFLTRQQTQMENVKQLLNKEWKDSAVEILREELENLDRDQTQTFFDSVATLMSNQARELITKSINEYVSFMRQFKRPTMDDYPTP